MKKADPSSFSGGKGTVPGPDLEIRGVPGHPDLKIRIGPVSKKKFFRSFGPQFGLKIRGEHGPPGPLPWIRHRGRFERTCSQATLGI